MLSDPMKLEGILIPAIVAGLVSRSITHPLETLGARLQVDSTKLSFGKSNLALKHYQTLLSTEGWRGLYRGFSMTFIMNIPGSALYMFSYEYFKQIFSRSPFGQGIFCNALSGFLAEASSCVLWVCFFIISFSFLSLYQL